MGQRSADVPRADQRNLVPRHGIPFRNDIIISGAADPTPPNSSF